MDRPIRAPKAPFENNEAVAAGWRGVGSNWRCTPLALAVRAGRGRVVRCLLARGARIDGAGVQEALGHVRACVSGRRAVSVDSALQQLQGEVANVDAAAGIEAGPHDLFKACRVLRAFEALGRESAGDSKNDDDEEGGGGDDEGGGGDGEGGGGGEGGDGGQEGGDEDDGSGRDRKDPERRAVKRSARLATLTERVDRPRPRR